MSIDRKDILSVIRKDGLTATGVASLFRDYNWESVDERIVWSPADKAWKRGNEETVTDATVLSLVIEDLKEVRQSLKDEWQESIFAAVSTDASPLQAMEGELDKLESMSGLKDILNAIVGADGKKKPAQSQPPESEKIDFNDLDGE